ncbi:MAG: hypothetical protein QNJ94_17245 [Alphaproteobacteria bacterium]|nr:hypothetical protein [Alphaproteobacteria bacterium]
MNFFETLIHPDKEDQPERAVVAHAANLLQVGEFQLLQLAYKDWYGEEMPEGVIDRLFHSYMLYNEVPHWARQYARKIVNLEGRGDLDDLDPAYHVYDADYHTFVPDGVRKFIVAASILVLCIGGGIWVANIAATKSLSILPPYFESKDFRSSR